MMTEAKFTIRKAEPDELSQILAVYASAFKDEDLSTLVTELLPHEEVIHLVAETDGELCGHIAFSLCGDTSKVDAKHALLGPLAIAENWQKQGLGTRLISAGMDWLEACKISKVLVLGDPNYYSRHGFQPREETITAPYPLPSEWADAWQSITFTEIEEAATLVVPEPWQQPEYWQ